MQAIRTAVKSPRETDIESVAAAMRAHCITCADCQGVCAELIELMTLPETLAAQRRPT
ncbi:MAG: hypothetical protein H6884_03980 [Rhodobiaceae bacterium]|nr:hypothetical protein [Rhodobiaceae bacterium]